MRQTVSKLCAHCRAVCRPIIWVHGNIQQTTAHVNYSWAGLTGTCKQLGQLHQPTYPRVSWSALLHHLAHSLFLKRQVVQGNCGITPNKLQQFWSILFHVLWGPLHHQKKFQRSELWISNYQGSKVKVSQSETRIQKWANKRCTHRVWCRFIGNRT